MCIGGELMKDYRMASFDSSLERKDSHICDEAGQVKASAVDTGGPGVRNKENCSQTNPDRSEQ